MAVYYFDASAVVKYYVTEPGSTWVRQLIEARDATSAQVCHHIFIAEITRVEVAAGLAVIERIGRIKRAEREREYRRCNSQIVHRYAIIPLTTGDLESAAYLTQTHPLKAYDAVQLAVALRHRQFLASYQHIVTFVCSDHTLLAAAQAERLLTENPFDHVSPHDTPESSGEPVIPSCLLSCPCCRYSRSNH
jgi:predicted nucleic acid-binding protein